MKQPTSRARLAVSAAVTAGLCLAGTAALAPPSNASGTCDTAAPVSGLTAGEAVNGLTVSNGTTPSAFTGTILGVVTDGVEPGVDMVMAKLTSPDIDANGIWEGMSGSPVYDTSGNLIGAVAYTLAYGQTDVAGITPWEDMDKYAGSSGGSLPGHVAVSSRTAQKIAARTDVTASQASEGFHELATPAVVAGVSQAVVNHTRTRPYLSKSVAAAGHSAPGDETIADMVAGGNLVATESTGDVTIGGLGTITSVCGGTVVGFGHPMNFLGKTTYGMAGASALYIQNDPLGSSFKVANIGSVLGTINNDRMTGISGPLGVIPATIPVTSTVNYNDGTTTHSRTGQTDVQLPAAAAEATFYELASNTQNVMDAYTGGGESQTWTVTGTTAAGPFTFHSGDVYADRYDLVDTSSYDLPDLVYALTQLRGVTVDSVHVTSNITDNSSTLKVSTVQQKVGSSWVAVTKKHPAMLRGGHTATMRLLFPGGKTSRFKLAIPASAHAMRGDMDVQGGYPFPFERGGLGTFAGIQKAVANLTRNDQARVQMVSFGKTGYLRVVTKSAPVGTVMSGNVDLPVRIS